jgi:fission 1 protein
MFQGIKNECSNFNNEKFFSEIMQLYPLRRRECLFYLALGNYKIGEFRTGLKYINELLALEPDNTQATMLKDNIEGKITNGKTMSSHSY